MRELSCHPYFFHEVLFRIHSTMIFRHKIDAGGVLCSRAKGQCNFFISFDTNSRDGHREDK
jgi:hypothetical protein